MATTTDPLKAESHPNQSTSRRVAIVGAGVAGLAASWALNEFSDHEVVLFEANNYVGGHTNTVTFEKDGRKTPVDSGFIVTRQFTNRCSIADDDRLPTLQHIRTCCRS